MECDLTKEETYTMLARMIEKEATMNDNQLETLVTLLNKDLKRNANVDNVFGILKAILAKIKAGTYPKISLLRDTIPMIVSRLLSYEVETIKTDSDDKFQLYAEIFIDFPDDIVGRSYHQIKGDVIKIVKNHLTPVADESRCQSVCRFFTKFINSLSKVDRLELIRDNIEFCLSDLMIFLFMEKNKNRKFGLDVMGEISPCMMNVDYFESHYWTEIADNVQDTAKYPEILIRLLRAHDSDWFHLWILIVKLCKTQLHEYGKKINPLLFVLQEGFKSDVDFKYLSFHCLRTLIENFALNEKVLFNPSRIKLVSIALESNNAKNGEIALLKYDVWWELIGLLQSNIKSFSTLILTPFLHYCFGECRTTKPHRDYPGERYESLQKLAIKSLVEIFGHVDCVGCTGCDFKKLKQPFLDTELMDSLRPLLLHSLRSCTLYVYKHLLTSNKSKSTFESLIQNLKCIWKSFIKASSSIKGDNFKCIMKTILNMLKGFVEEHASSPLFAEIIMTIIIPSITDKDFGYSASSLQEQSNGNIHLYTPIQTLLKFILLPKLYHADTMSAIHFDFDNVVQITLSGDTKSNCSWLIDELTYDNHSPLLWCSIVNVLSDPTVKLDAELFQSVLMWPVTKYHSGVKIANVATAWRKFYCIQKSQICNTKEKTVTQVEEDLYILLLKACNKITKVSLIAIYFLPFIIKKCSEEKPGQMVLINRFLIGLEKLLINISVSNMSYLTYIGLNDSIKYLTSVLLDCNTYHVSLTSADQLISVLNINMKNIKIYLQQEVMNQNSTSLEISMSIQSLLENLNKLLIPTYLPRIYHTMVDLVKTLMDNHINPDIDAKCSLLLNNLIDPNKIETNLVSSELVKIRALLKVHEKANNPNEPKSSTPQSKGNLPNIKSFVKNIQSKPKSKEDSEFVVIKSNWKFDPKNLTDHQKDSLKRRRDDIPALYEDLSQSQDEPILKSWKPPGYKSTEESSNSLEISQDVVNINLLNNTNKEKSDTHGKDTRRDIKSYMNKPTPRSEKVLNFSIVNGINQTNSKKSAEEADLKKSIINSRQHVSVMKESNGLLDNNSKDKIDQVSKLSEYKKTGIENVESTNINLNSLEKLKNAGPVTNRLENLLKKLNSPKNKNAQISGNDEKPLTIGENSEINKSKQNSPVNDTSVVQVIRKIGTRSNSSNNVAMSMENNDKIKKNTKKDIDLETSSNLQLENDTLDSDKAKKRKRKSMDSGDTVESNIKNNIDSDYVPKRSELNEQNETNANVAIRPTRIRRKPTKFLNDELTAFDTKKSKNNAKSDDKSTVAVDVTEKSTENMKSEMISLIPDKSVSSPLSLKKKSRLINQLLIDTNEGHPLIHINNADKKTKSRRSLTTKFEITNKKKNDVPAAKEEKNEEKIVAKDDNVITIDSNTDEGEIKTDVSNRVDNIDEPSENLKTTITIRIKSNVQNNGKTNIINEIPCVEEETPDTLSENTPNPESKANSPSILDEKIPLLDQDVQNIADVDTVCINSESVVSIYSQETQIAPSSSKKVSNVDLTNILSASDHSGNDYDNNVSQSDDISIIPDTIESSQEENASCTSLKTVLSKSKLQGKQNSVESITKNIDASEMSSQEIAEADTLPILDEDQEILPSSSNVTCDSTTLQLEGDVTYLSNDDQDCDTTKNIINTSLHNITSSPCYEDVEDRNKELLNSTLGISPIKITFELETSIISSPQLELGDGDDKICKLPSDTTLPIKNVSFVNETSSSETNNVADDVTENENLVISNDPILTSSSSPDLFSSEKMSPSKEIISTKEISPPKMTPPSTTSVNSFKNNRLSVKFAGSRTAHLLSLCMMNNDEEKSNDCEMAEVEDTSNIKSNITTSEQSNSETSNVYNTDSSEVRPLLAFTKLVPSANASPIGPILKRKFENDDLTVSPSSKKKRVSFHDPPVSFTMDVEKYIDSKPVKSPQVKDSSPNTNKIRLNVAKCLMKNIENIIQNDNSTLNEDEFFSDFKPKELSTSEDRTVSDLCSLEVNQPQNMDIQTNSMLDDKLPVYPNLIDCLRPISEIASELSSPMWKDEFLTEISNKITTIHDLAKLTELEINRLPIKYPKIETVRQALIKYEANLNKEVICDYKSETMNNNQYEEKVADDPIKNSEKENDPDIVSKLTVNDVQKSDDQCTAEDEVKNVDMETDSNITEEKCANVNTVLNGIQLDDIINYLSTKMENDAEVQNKVFEKFGFSELKKSEEKRSREFKLMRDTLDVQFKNIISSFDDVIGS